MAVAQRNNWNVGNAEVSPHSHFAPLLGKHGHTLLLLTEHGPGTNSKGGGLQQQPHREHGW